MRPMPLRVCACFAYHGSGVVLPRAIRCITTKPQTEVNILHYSSIYHHQSQPVMDEVHATISWPCANFLHVSSFDLFHPCDAATPILPDYPGDCKPRASRAAIGLGSRDEEWISGLWEHGDQGRRSYDAPRTSTIISVPCIWYPRYVLATPKVSAIPKVLATLPSTPRVADGITTCPKSSLFDQINLQIEHTQLLVIRQRFDHRYLYTNCVHDTEL